MSKDNLKIVPIDIDDSKFNRDELEPFVFPSCIIALGAVASGKSTWLANFVRITEPIFKGNVILFSPTLKNDPILDKLIDDDDILEFFENYTNGILQKVLETIGETDDDQKYLIIFDDILGSLPRANSRDAKWFDKFGDKRLKQLAEELHPATGDNEADFYRIYNEAKKDPYDFLMLDFRKMKAYRNLTEVLYQRNPD